MGVDLTNVPVSGLFNAWPLAVQMENFAAHDLLKYQILQSSAPRSAELELPNVVSVYHSHPYRIEWYSNG
jgi:proteasome lid subunit RPN8/RPN11